MQSACKFRAKRKLACVGLDGKTFTGKMKVEQTLQGRALRVRNKDRGVRRKPVGVAVTGQHGPGLVKHALLPETLLPLSAAIPGFSLGLFIL